MNKDLPQRIADVQEFISETGFTTAEMLVLIGFLQSQTYEKLQKDINEVRL